MRSKGFIGIFLGLLLGASSWAQQTPAPSSSSQTQQETPANQDGQNVPTFRKNVNLVNVMFTVRDKHNGFVPGLSKDSFELLEDGQPQVIKYFSAETKLPLTLGLLIDSSLSMERMLAEEKIVAADFFRQVLTDKDLAFVISFDTDVDLLQDLTNDVHLLRSGLDRAHIRGNTAAAIPGVGEGPVPTMNQRGTLLFDAIYLASDEVLGKQVGRKAMVIITDGQDEGSRLKLRDAIEAAQKSDSICYVLLLSDPHFGSNTGDMKRLTEETGGRVINVDKPDKLKDAFNQISDELRNEYSLGYTPTNEKHDGVFRKIEIKSRNGYKIQARKGYYPPTS